MSDKMYYNTDHLSTEEIKEVASAVWMDYLEAHGDRPKSCDCVLHTHDLDELSDEYQFWIGEYRRRRNEETAAE